MTTELTRIDKKTHEIEQILTSKKQWISLVKRYVSPVAFMRVLSTEIQINPKLADCTTQSIVNSFLYCAQLNLMPGSATKEVYLVPFKDTCTPILGYQGEVKLMERHDSVAKIEARAVYKGEEATFEARQGTESVIIHPYRMEIDRKAENLIAVYAVAFYMNGTHKAVIMTRQQVDQHRARSRAADKGPWVTDYTAMALKTAVHELADLVPKEYQAAVAITADEAADRGESAIEIVLGPDQYREGPQEPPKSQAGRVSDRIRGTAGGKPENAATGQAGLFDEEAERRKRLIVDISEDQMYLNGSKITDEAVAALMEIPLADLEARYEAIHHQANLKADKELE